MSRAEIEHETVAEQFGTSLLDHAGLLAEFPRLGVPVPGGWRRLFHSPFYIYYTVYESKRRVDIERFWHFRRRPPKGFNRR